MSRSSSSIVQAERRRGVIVLGDPFMYERIAQICTRSLTKAHNVFEVIGEVAAGTLGDGPESIILSLNTVGDRGARLIESIRAIDPAVTIIGFVDMKDAVGASTSAGFDALVTEQVERAVLEDAIMGVGQGDWTAGQSRSEPSTAQAVDQDSADGPLGDIDLVTAITHGRQSIGEVAARIIEQETGWSGVAVLDAKPGDEGDAEVCTQIRDDTTGSVLGYLLVGGDCPAALSAVRSWAQWLGLWLGLAREHQTLRSQAHLDDLTGAANRRHLELVLPVLIADAQKRRQCVSVLLFDIDDFKKYNDRYGHAAGDEILVETVRLLRSVIRPHDEVCRIGGDEFVVVFHDPEGKRDAASDHPRDIQGIARRFQEQIAQHRFPKLSHEAPGELTISGGIATYPWDGSDIETLLAHADRNLFASKRSGKNAITFGPDVDEPDAGSAGASW